MILHAFMNYCGIIDIWIIIFSDLSIRSFRKKYLMHMHMYCDLMSEMTLSTCILIVFKSDVGVLNYPG